VDRQFRPVFSAYNQVDLLIAKLLMKFRQSIEFGIDDSVGSINLWFYVQIDISPPGLIIDTRSE